ncbi:MAG: hypothetical protein IPL78_31495 [Chloroflexi bacterium]|nr:hypothetical protein [Chloroflexota bacterium]
MENETILLQALSAGAAASFQPNLVHIPITKEPLYETYEALKDDLRGRYPNVQADILDIGPASAERWAILAQELQSSGAAADEQLNALALKLLEEIDEHLPDAAAAAHVDMNHVEAPATPNQTDPL